VTALISSVEQPGCGLDLGVEEPGCGLDLGV